MLPCRFKRYFIDNILLLSWVMINITFQKDVLPVQGFYRNWEERQPVNLDQTTRPYMFNATLWSITQLWVCILPDVQDVNITIKLSVLYPAAKPQWSQNPFLVSKTCIFSFYLNHFVSFSHELDFINCPWYIQKSQFYITKTDCDKSWEITKCQKSDCMSEM